MKPLRILFIGPPEVGKTSLIQQFAEKRFLRSYIPTVEDMCTQVIQCPDGLCRAVEFMDLSGGDEFPVMRELRVKQADMYIVVFSVDHMASLTHAIQYCTLIRSATGCPDAPLLFVGNKCDVKGREVPQELALELTKKYNVPYMEVSARLATNVHSMIDAVLSIKHCSPYLPK